VRGPFCEGHTYFGPFFALWVLCGITLDGTSPSIRTPSGVFGCYPLVAFSCFKATKGVYVRRYAIIRLVGGAAAIAVSVVWVMYVLVLRCEERTL
jgi:hypothetical protein